jgi:tripartite-type tricarboxylate transporter receptor subunit TctC
MIRHLCLIAGALFALFSPADAQTFATKPTRIVVPYPAGGAVDNIVRALTDRLRDKWGTIIIENKSGGATQIGTEYVARAEPDGHTILATGMETFSINPFIYTKLSSIPRASCQSPPSVIRISCCLFRRARHTNRSEKSSRLPRKSRVRCNTAPSGSADQATSTWFCSKRWPESN